MRIMQLIDSLETGGAERMAVNYANALNNHIDFSALVATRKEGALKELLNSKTAYLFLNKKSSIDISALWRLRKFIIENKIDVVHAHSTSFFTAFLLKLIHPSIYLIWHDHYGDSDFLDKRKKQLFRVLVPFFSGIIVVNNRLKKWAEIELNCKNTIYIPNFSAKEKKQRESIKLKGISGKRIVCLANLRPQKNHFLLIELAQNLKVSHPDWSFHLVGKDFDDNYSKKIKDKIEAANLQETVFLYGSQKAVPQILAQATIGILTSQSEGLPVALLEYGWAKLPVVTTHVGEIPSVIKHSQNGFVVPVDEVQFFYRYVVTLVTNKSLQYSFGNALKTTMEQKYSEESALQEYLPWLQKVLK
jgi:glycosyltransferase involved in cell wall biosynthesis